MSLILPRRYQSRATGAHLQATLVDGIRAHQGLLAHIRDARGLDVVGVPDLFGVVNGIEFWLEVKGYRDKLSPAQRRWIGELEGAEQRLVEVVTWKNLDETLAALGIETR